MTSVVIAHDFAEAYGGAERVIAEVAAEFPDAPFFAIAGRRAVAERMGVADRFQTLLPSPSWLLSRYRLAAPIYPTLIRHRRVPECDVLVTGSYAYIHGLRTVNTAPQLCYCHGPLRHAWTQEAAYAAGFRGGALTRHAFSAFARSMRRADLKASRRVTRYLAGSPFTAEQIERFYGAPATIVRPPVDTDVFSPAATLPEDWFLFAGRLVETYKKPSLVVRAFAQLPDQRLRIAGDGPALAALRAIATPNVEFLGNLGTAELADMMGRCRATIFPSVDDFGLIPVEVAACGRPVLAYAAGGALHTVADGISGRFFAEQSADAIAGAVRAFDPEAWDPAAIRSHAMQFDRKLFRAAIRCHVEELARG